MFVIKGKIEFKIIKMVKYGQPIKICFKKIFQRIKKKKKKNHNEIPLILYCKCHVTTKYTKCISK